MDILQSYYTLSRGFPKHFVIPPFLCSKLSLYKTKSLFSGLRHEEISRESAEPCKPLCRSRAMADGGARGKALGSLAYLGSDNLLL